MCKGDTVKAGTHTQFHDYVQEENPTTTTRPTTTLPTIKETTNVTNGTGLVSNNTTVEPLLKSILPRIWWWRPKPDPLKTLNTRPRVETFDIKFSVTREMMPSCRVMVYYVRRDKEVVADSVDFDVEDKLQNQVRIISIE
jgi:hypothetical protein